MSERSNNVGIICRSSVSKFDKLIFKPFNVSNVGICLWGKFDF